MKKDLENGVPRSKVIHLITTINIGGAENQLALLSQLQSENGSEVTIIPLKDCGDAQKVKFSSNVKIYRGVTNRNVILQVISLIRYLRAVDPDVIHAHLPRAEVFSAIIVKILRRSQLICTKHNAERFWHNQSKFVSRQLSLFVERQSAGTICISKSVRNYLVDTTKELKNLEKCHVIYYGYSKVRSTKKVSEKKAFKINKRLDQEKYSIVSVARLVPQKNLENLIYAMPHLDSPKITLDIYGDGELRGHLSGLIKRLNLDNRVRLMLKTSKIQEVYDSHDMFVFPSKYEGLGLALLEAIDSHLRVAVSRIDIFEEILGRDYPFFFNEDSSQDIANVIHKLALGHTFNRLIFAQTILEKFDPKKMYTRVDEVYRASLQRK
jgi:glycosyltransferase involved in cell wall biosynthesis